MAKQKVRATRHNGRKGENGVFKAGHNDRSFDVDAAEHIDPSRSFMNVYWDMYQGYNIAGADGVRPERRFSFEEIEKAFYSNQFGDSLDAQEEGNNILAFMKSEGYLQFEIGKKISSTDFYNIYVSWCEDNLEKSRASAGFLHYIKENQKRYGLIYDAKCIGNRRGFHNVCKAEFTPVVCKTPFD